MTTPSSGKSRRNDESWTPPSAPKFEIAIPVKVTRPVNSSNRSSVQPSGYEIDHPTGSSYVSTGGTPVVRPGDSEGGGGLATWSGACLPASSATTATPMPAAATTRARTPVPRRRVRWRRRRWRARASKASSDGRTCPAACSRSVRRSLIGSLHGRSQRGSALRGQGPHGGGLHAQDPAGLVGAVAEQLREHERGPLARREAAERPGDLIAVVRVGERISAGSRPDDPTHSPPG